MAYNIHTDMARSFKEKQAATVYEFRCGAYNGDDKMGWVTPENAHKQTSAAFI